MLYKIRIIQVDYNKTKPTSTPINDFLVEARNNKEAYDKATDFCNKFNGRFLFNNGVRLDVDYMEFVLSYGLTIDETLAAEDFKLLKEQII